MAKLSMECKKIVVDEIANRLNQADTLIVTNYKGLSAKDLNELRKELKGISSEYLVVKDSMAKKALAENPNSNKVAELVEGEVGIAIDKKPEAIYISKVLMKFSKDHQFLKIIGGFMGGKAISKDDIKVLSMLPSKEALLGQLANVLNAPIQGLAASLNAVICKILYALNAVKDEKEKEPGAKAKEEPQAEKPEENKEQGNTETKPA